MEFGGYGGSDIFVMKANSEGMITRISPVNRGKDILLKYDGLYGQLILESTQEIERITLWDGLGKELYPAIKKLEDSRAVINIRDLPPGLILICCQTAGNVRNLKYINR
jgi:hypothetical protein